MAEVRGYTPGWWFFATPRDLQCRAAAPYHPAFQLLFDTSRPFWVRVLGCRDVPREWLRTALDGGRAGVFDAVLGGVQVAREAGELRFDLRGDGGDAVLWLPVAAVRVFLGRTELLVPFGLEGDHLDWSPSGWAA